MCMSWDCRQSPLKALLNTFGMYHKTHGMATRYGSQETEDIPDSQDSNLLDLVPWDYPVLERDNYSSNEYCEDTDTCHPLAYLLVEFQQVKNQFASLNLTFPNPHPQRNCYNWQINCSITSWHSNQPPVQWGTSTQDHAAIHRHPACNKERVQSHHNYAPRYPHIWWASLFKVKRLVHGYRNCHWHPDRRPHIPGWGQIMQPYLHTHLWGHSNREVLGWNQRHPEIETLQCKYPHLYLKIYENTAEGQ